MSDRNMLPAISHEELQAGQSAQHERAGEEGNSTFDIANLLESMQIATVFLDRNLAIRSFTAAAKDMFRLTTTDTGRPISHVRARFHHDSIQADAERVIRTLSPIEHQVKCSDNDSRYLMRMMPCRAMDNTITGIVITVVDITDIVTAEPRIKELARDLRNGDGRERASRLSTGDNSIHEHTGVKSTARDPASLPREPDTELTYGNVLLDSLDIADRILLLPSLELVELPEGGLSDAEPQIHFPINCLISTRPASPSGKQIELRSVSRHSATLAEMLYGDPGKVTSVVLVSGKSWRISVKALRGLVESNAHLRARVLGDLRAAMGEYAESIFLAGRATIVERTARWLVLTCCALEIEALNLKHDALAEVLGVHRPSITIALQTLEGMGLIRSTRRSIRIRDMNGLETLAKRVPANAGSKETFVSAQ